MQLLACMKRQLRCYKQLLMIASGVPIFMRGALARPLRLPFLGVEISDRVLLALILLAVVSASLDIWLKIVPRDAARGAAYGPAIVPLDIPDNACYFCIQRPATSKCGGCRLVYYCGRMCQMQAWRKHRHVCGAASAAATRIQRSEQTISPSQWRVLQEYSGHVKLLLTAPGVVPTSPAVAAQILSKIGAFIQEHPEIVRQEIADSVWAAALSMRSDGEGERFHMAWAWGFLEATVEGGSADAFLAALGMGNGGHPDLARVNRWMRRGLCQALLMLNRRHEVGPFLRASPRVATG